MFKKFSISRDDSIYEAWPDVVLLPDEKMICIFAECTHHGDRSYTRIVLTDSSDRGRTWSAKRPLTEGTKDKNYHYNNPRISLLKDGRLVAVVDRLYANDNSLYADENNGNDDKLRIVLYFSSDNGKTWTEGQEIPARGIVPDKLLELDSGRWIVACHYKPDGFDYLTERLWYSDDKGESWHGPVIVGQQEGLNLCEASILPIEGSTLVAFMRENSFTGKDCYKTISYDNGESWSAPIRFPLPGCHRPVSGFLQDGKIMLTFRFLQGGRSGFGNWTQNFFGALSDKESALNLKREGSWTRIFPIDYDRSPISDLGYSGWVQFEDGEVYIVHYIVDDAPNAQIRGYSLQPENLILQGQN